MKFGTYDNESPEPQRQGLSLKPIYWFGGIFIVLILIFSSFYVVRAGQRAVVMTWGDPDLTPKAEGLHLKWPVAQKVVKMDVQTLKYEAELTAASRDLQDVKTKIAINYHIDSQQVSVIYRDIGVNYADKLIYPLEQEANKATTSQFTAEELNSKRESVREQMKNLLSERLRGRGIIIEEISIIDFKYSDAYTQSIEAKVVAEQNALTAKNKLEQIKYEAEQRITQAKGEAEAQKIQIEAIKQQGGSQYIELQAINKWNGQLPMFVGSGMPFINVPMNQSK